MRRRCFGTTYMRGWRVSCRASEGPVVRIPPPRDWPRDYVVFRQKLPPGERQRCADGTRDPYHTIPRGFGMQAGAVLDVDLGER